MPFSPGNAGNPAVFPGAGHTACGTALQKKQVFREHFAIGFIHDIILRTMVLIGKGQKEMVSMFDVKKKAQELNDQVIRWRRTLHAHPEVGFNTAATEKLIVEELEKMGADEIRHGNGMRGIVALIKGKKPGKVLGIRADYDALNMTEDTGLPFAASNGNMHACGHDAHAAMLLGTAKILTECRDDLQG
ncbi:MAG: M20/M25/M40 family metallo-hydrolase, partial [Synergistales bacterium]|nr:M20/M25/M40 family metallo-hydrolase [Synergistales bacterium]